VTRLPPHDIEAVYYRLLDPPDKWIVVAIGE
jgi:hypothetical protein